MRTMLCLCLLALAGFADTLPTTRLGWIQRFAGEESGGLRAVAESCLVALDAPEPDRRDAAEERLLRCGAALAPWLAEALARPLDPERAFRLERVVEGLWTRPPAEAFLDGHEDAPFRVSGDYTFAPQPGGPFDVRYVVREDGEERFRLDGHPQTAWCVVGDVLFYPRYHRMSSGCEVVAVDLTSGAERWSVVLQGLGMIAHSKYWNQVNLYVGDGEIVICGNESAGRYVEILDATDGAQVFHALR